MKYYFKQSDIIDESATDLKGVLHEITEKGLKKIKALIVNSKTDPKIRGAIICQKVAEGDAIVNIVKQNPWTPSAVEFFVWIKKHKQLLDWYQDALKIRDHIVIDKVYAKIKDLDYGADENIEKVTSVLNEMKKALKDKDKDTFKEAIQIYSPVVKKWTYGKK